MAANPHIRKGTVLAFTSPKAVPAYVYVARRPPNANYGLGYVFVAADVDLEHGLVADDALTCCQMGFKDTVGEWPVVAQQPHDDAEWPIPKMYVPMPGLEGKMHYRLDTFAENVITVIRRERATAEQCRGRPGAAAFMPERFRTTWTRCWRKAMGGSVTWRGGRPSGPGIPPRPDEKRRRGRVPSGMSGREVTRSDDRFAGVRSQ